MARYDGRYRELRDDDHGATMVEYALMIALIALVCITAVQFVGTGTNASFGNPALINAS
jgi:pilus assembly protein Flp/PilA